MTEAVFKMAARMAEKKEELAQFSLMVNYRQVNSNTESNPRFGINSDSLRNQISFHILQTTGLR